MITIPECQIIRKIYESDNTLVYRARRNQDNIPVILKILKEDYPTPEEIVRYRHEYEATCSLNLKGVVKAHGLERYENTFFIIFEDVGAESLDVLMDDKKFTLNEFLAIAIKTVESLEEIHAQNIIHKDINPSNIIFNPETGRLQIIDFGISTILPHENPALKNPEVIEGTLSYISPEQTGRMNRAIDYRTDFYSLGATFYELLLQKTPFNGTDSMELVHCHMAREPEPPYEVNQEIPKVVSDIVMKLLAKSAENRYQSAGGIKADLEECLNELGVNGNIPTFSLGRNDISDRFQIPQKLYGREQEVDILKTTFERVSEGKSEMLLISGRSGIGKTALVQEMYMPVTQQRGYFISGKFEQFQRNVPYSAVINAFQDLVRQLLAENEEKLNCWRKKILKALGPNGQVIIDVIPEVELIIGPQPPVAELSPAETKNRFDLVFQNFIRAFSRPEHPLVLFLDDLQWIDTASLKLIQVFMAASDSRHLLLIGAYRDNEVRATHTLILTVDKIQKAGATVNRISLMPLNSQHVNQFVSYSLTCTPEKALPLAELVLAKTNGNPFFVGEFLKSLFERKLLEFDHEHFRWKWSMGHIQAQNVTDNVVELIVDRVLNLRTELQETLKFAAYIGNQFELKTLATVCEKTKRETTILLQEAVAEGFISPLGDKYKSVEFDVPELADGLTVEYRFSHDRVQQAVYSLVPEPERQTVHLKMGRLLLKEIPPDSQERKVFDIVNQLNHGAALIHLQSEKDELARLNLIAGKKAKAAAAYEPAFRYLSTGIELLTSLHLHPLIEANQKDSCWQTQYDLALALHVEAAEAAYLCTEFEKMDELVQVVLNQAEDLLDKVKVYEVKIQALIAQNKSLEGVKTGLAALRLLGVKFPEKPNKLEIVLALLKTRFILYGKRIEDLVDLPEMNDPIKLAAIRILMNLGTAAYFSAPDLFPLIVFKGVNLSVKHGNSHESTIAYSSYGIILCTVLGDIETGYRFGQLALRLLSRFNGGGLRARTLEMVNNFVKHWKEPLRKGLELSLEAFQSGLETGDFEWASYAAQNYCVKSFIVGKELGGLEQELKKYSEVIGKLKQEIPFYASKLNQQTVLNLIDKSENPYRLVGQSYNEEKMLSRHLKANDGCSLFALYLTKTLLCYLFQKHHEAIENAAKAEKYLDNVTGEAGFPQFHFYYSLSLLAVFLDTQKLEKKRILKKVAVNQKKMRKWAHHAPINYLHKFYLVEAERSRVLGEDTKAIEFYDQAINLAGKHEYINDEALANELAARFYLANNKNKNAEKYMTDARYCYLRWGALAKVKDLDTRYPELLGKTPDKAKTETESFKKTFETTVNGSGKKFDWISVMKVAKAISSEIVLSKLLNKLMRIVIENAGARKGILILQSEGKLFIEAESSVEQDSIMLLHSVPVEKAKNLSLAIINYVSKTHEYVILNNPAQDSVFMNDAYIIAHRPKSILCGPLLHKSKLIGMLYLENSLLTDAFATKRLEVIKLLGSQIAVSLENARLYTGMEAHTKKIKAINSNLQREITQRKKAEAELTRYQDHLEELVEQRTAELEKSQRALANLERDIEKRHRFQNIVGKSERMQVIYSLIDDLADLSATVLITGESGTGKELVAEALHYSGKRQDKPFVKVNCSALSETILESELFGHVKGAFTGADRDKGGRFQKAGDGTIFLDEIGDISPYFQKRLLRVLQEREFEQVGDTTPKKMKARVLAATNQDLLKKVRRGEFRKDLYYRLRVVALNLPPLRDRREDIPLLLRHFLKYFSNELGKEITDVSKDVLKQFMECPWPGNIRELQNTLEHICILCKDSTITVDDLPADFTDLAGPETSFGNGDADTPRAILLALEEAKWNKTRAAHLLGISRRTLYRKLEEHNMMESIKIH